MRRLSASIVAASLLVAGVSAQAETVKVGLIAPFSGGFAIWGQQFQQAVKAYQAVNGDSVKGNKIELIYRDVGGPDPAKARQLAEELVLRERVKFLTGFAFSNNSMAVAEVITEAKIPTIIMNAATARITRLSPYYVRASMTLPQHAFGMATWAAKNGIKKVYVLVSDYAPGHDAEKQFIKTFTKDGGTIVGKVRIPLRTTDYAPFMERVRQAKPDAVYIFMPAGPPSISTVNAWAKRGLKADGIKLIGSGEIQEIYFPTLGDSAIGIVSALHYTENLDNPQNKALKATLKKMFGPKTVPDIASVAAWDSMNLIYDAIRALGPDASGEAIVKFMAGREYQSPRGPIKIDAKERDIIQNIYIRRVVKRNGKLENMNIDVLKNVRDPWKDDNPAKK